MKFNVFDNVGTMSCRGENVCIEAAIDTIRIGIIKKPADKAGFSRKTEKLFNGIHVLNEFYDLVRIAPFVVVPRYEFNEVRVESYTCLSVEDRGTCIADEVRRYHIVFGVTEDTFEFVLRSLFDSGFDLIVRSGLFKTAGEVYYRYVECRNTERHTGKFTVEGGDNLAHSLSGAGRRRNDVAGSGTTTTPVLH